MRYCWALAQVAFVTATSVSTDMFRFALTALALSCSSLAEEIPGTTRALALDDACDSDACDLSLRQLRRESRSTYANDMGSAAAPKFNYNWNFGCTGKTDQEQPAGDDLTFNLNWNFCFR